MSDVIKEVVCTSKVPGAMRELVTLLQKEFNLSEEEIELHISYTDSVSLLLTKENSDKISIEKVKAYCNGFTDALDITEYLTTEYLNDR